MPKFWHGKVADVFWPRNSQLFVNLGIELWSTGQTVDNYTCQLLNGNEMIFNGFTSLDDIPLWTIITPEFTLMSTSTETRNFFTQFATLPENVALRFSTTDTEKASQEVVVYSVKDEVDDTMRIYGRIVDLSIIIDLPEKITQNEDVNFDSNRTDEQNKGVAKSGRPKAINAVSDVKSALSQTVMGALRLRGIKRTNPDFKKIYYAIHSLVDISLRKADPHDITVESIRSKVEEIFGVIE